MGVKAFLKREFTLKNLFPLHDSPVLFVVSQWNLDKSQPSILYLIYRIGIAIFFITTWSKSLSVPRYGIFLTNLGYTLCTLQVSLALILQLFSVAFRVFKQPILLEYTLKLHPLYWLTQATATTMAFTITIMFWSALYDKKTMGWSAMDFYLHGCNAIFLMVDIWVVGHPVRILHVIYPFLFGLGYVIFTIIYYSYDRNRGGTGYIYPILNWNKPLVPTFVVIGTAALIISFHLLTFGIFKLKLIIYKKIHSQSIQPNGKSTQSTEQLNADVI